MSSSSTLDLLPVPAASSSAPLVPPPPEPQTPVLFSLGTKMLLVTTGLLMLSFAICSAVTLTMARRMVRSDLEIKVSRESGFMAAASQALVQRASPSDREELQRLLAHLTEEPEILAVEVIDAQRHVLAHQRIAGRRHSDFFSLQVPIQSSGHTIGFVRAWYSPVLALEEVWTTTGHMVLVLFLATFILFSIVFFAAIERLLNRPFQNFVQALGQSPRHAQLLTFDSNRRDEWGVLGARLNTYLAYLLNEQERSSVLYETSRLLTSPGGLRDSLEGVLTGVLHRYQLTSALLFVHSASGLHVDASAGISLDFSKALTFQPGQGLLGVAYASGLLRRVEDASREDDSLVSELFKRQQVRTALFVPMKADGQTLGVAAYFSRQEGAFKEASTESLRSFTDHVALAFRNAQQVGALQSVNRRLESEVSTVLRELGQTNIRLIRKVRELKTVYDLALATAASTQVDDILRLIIEGIKELIEVQSGAFFVWDAATGHLEPLAPVFDRSKEMAAALRCKADESPLLHRVVVEGRAQIVNFVDPDEQLPAAWKPLAIRSLLAVPLRQGEEVKGLFCVVNKVNGLFSEDDSRVLSLLTGRVAEVLHRLELDRQLRQQVHDLQVLQDIAAGLPNPPVLTDTVSVIGRIVRAAMPPTPLCLFFLHHAGSEALVLMGGDWDKKLSFDLRALTIGVSEKVPLAEVFQSGLPSHFLKGASSSAWENDALIQAFGLDELFYLPLTIEKGTIGVMAIARRDVPPLGVEERRLAALIAKQVGVVIERSQLYERLRSANEKLEQINHLKNEFISMVSHELRTPLTTIKGFVSIVLNEETGPLNDQQRRFLETSDRAIDRLTLLVSDLLDISRIEAGQIKMQMRAISLKDVLSRVMASFQPQFKAQNLSLALQLPEHLPMVMGDPDRISQILDNLLSNALKFTTQGGVTISAVDKGDFVLTSVADTGNGIPKEEQDRIFEKFYQIKIKGTYPGKGTGLGLAIVRSIVDSHRGKVWVESESGKGCDFRFLLPRARTEAEPTDTTGKLT
jgi:signal transduction histidine kinase